MPNSKSSGGTSFKYARPWMRPLFKPYVVIILIFTLIMAAFLYLSNLNFEVESIYHKINTLREVRRQLTSAHLWSEELLGGDTRIDYSRQVNSRFLKVEEYLKDLDHFHHTELPEAILLENAREKLSKLREKVLALKLLSLERHRKPKESGIGSAIDEKYDKLFRQANELAEALEFSYEKYIKEVILWVEVVKGAIVFLILFSAILALVLFRNFYRKRKRIEYSLIEDEERFRELYNNISSGVAVYGVIGDGEDFRIVDLNRAGEKICLTTKDEVFGKPVSKVFPGVESMGLTEVFHRVWKTGIPENFPISSYQDDVRSIWVENYVYKLPTGEVVAVFDDVTEAKLAEDKIRNMAKFPEEDPNPVFRVNSLGQMIYANKSAQQMLSSWNCGLGDTIPTPYYKSCMNALQSQENRVVEADIDSRTYLMDLVPIPDKGYVNFYGMDITERKLIEQQLRQTQKMEAIGTLAGGIAHDFNNILTSIIGYSQLGLKHCDKGSSVSRYLDRVLESSKMARDLVKQILAFSRQKERTRKPKKLATLIRETLSLMKTNLAPGVQLKKNIEFDCLVECDPSEIRQIVMNLFTNAMQAVEEEEHGLLEVALKKVEFEKYESNPLKLAPGNYAEFSVKDNGKGISKDVIKRIFDPFFTTKAPGTGTGMGLSVIHGIIKELNGDITVESEEGKGSCFKVYLPVCDKFTSDTGEDNVVVPGNSEKVLFIDDDKLIAEMIYELLKILKYDVTVSTEPLNALKLIKADPDAFDVVITDNSMPDIKGMDLAKEIKKIKPEISIILCTGFAGNITDKQIKESGIDQLILKPIREEELAAALRKNLDVKLH
jgi:signal transduction histidine kinase/CheY-like chemotaxis protein